MEVDPVGISVRLLEEPDIYQVNAFYNSLHGTTRDRVQFEWEFLQAPAGKAIYVVAYDESDHRIIGTQCVIPIDLVMADGSVVRSGKSEDTLVDPHYRGRGVFERMYACVFKECERQGVVCIWGFTSAVKPFERIGFGAPFRHGQGLFVRNIGGAFGYLDSLAPGNGAIKRMSIFGLCVVARCSGMWHRMLRSKLPEDLRMELSGTVHPDADGSLDERIRESSPPGSFRIGRSPAFMDWRFIRNPYRVKFWQARLFKGAELLADAIFSMGCPGVCYLVQERAAPSLSLEIRRMFLSKAMIGIEEQQKVVLWRSWYFEHDPVDRGGITHQRAAGWIHLDRGISFVWKALDRTKAPDANAFILSRLATEGVS